jgi:hypothetical protein
MRPPTSPPRPNILTGIKQVLRSARRRRAFLLKSEAEKRANAKRRALKALFPFRTRVARGLTPNPLAGHDPFLARTIVIE